MKTNWLLVIGAGVLVGLLLVACFAAILFATGFAPSMGNLLGRPYGQQMGPGMMGRGYSQRFNIPSTFKSNGERIYLTASSASGQPITFSGGPMWRYRHDGSCVSCHGPDGRGGYPVMMGAEVPPDITYGALTKEGFTDETIKRAITQGLDEGGKSLAPTMPRWQMSDADLNDLIEYLKTLGK
jgi:mono/diheme cytochrome c family protein